MVLARPQAKEYVRYRRHRFVARFPRQYLYSPAHFWLAQDDDDDVVGEDVVGEDGVDVDAVWHVGLTHFAVRMLGEIVEFDVERTPGDEIALGEVIGWVEGMKAVTDLYSVARGELVQVNPESLADPELLCKDPYAAGWIYSLRGTPDERCTGVEEYLETLGETLDAMNEEPWRQ